ncbi:hypothetical protein VMCG_09083 [Cytospora schulzeri]|uniref:MIT domain-containing protein n=1 Tax=Cytospora schulzeri TaxID=448051 RepID=A0A423VP42_9PEZI|nr:hypothetical protein VMCG_09083 [Valsa malicola]
MPSPRHATHAHANPPHAHAPVSASASAATAAASLPASAYNFHLNTASTSNLFSVSKSKSISTSDSTSNPNFGPTSRSASQATIGRKPLHHQQHQPQQQYYDSPTRPTHPNYIKPSHIANNTPHISSAVNFPASRGGSFSAASLPRSSSLLPPPQITADDNTGKLPTLHDPFANPYAAVPTPNATSASNFADPLNDREFDDSVSPRNTRRRPSKAHSRSSSLGGLSDGFRNLNRWSISTSSSRASNAASTKRFSRRISIDSTTLFSQSSSVSPRRLLKSRPSTAGGSPEDRRPSIPPFATLPPIIQLPSLSQDDLVGAALSGFQEDEGPKQEHNTHLPGPGAAENNSGRVWDASTTAGDSSYMSTSARATPDPSLPTSAFNRGATMPRTESAAGYREKGHSRSRSQGLKSSQDSTSSSQRNPSRSKQPSQKAMLSKALQKANTAVQLDNAQNFEGARSAYQEACDLLHQVLLRTAGDEDKKKLDAIRVTYSSRIEELDQMLPEDVEDSKALPQRPTSNGTGSTLPGYDRTRNDSVVDDDRVARLRSDSERSQQAQWSVPNYARPTSAAWRPQHSPKPSLDGPRYVTPTPTNFSEPYNRSQSAFSQTSPRHDRILEQDVFVARPMDGEYMPPPLSPRRPISPTTRVSPDASPRADFSSSVNRFAPETSAQWGHEQEESHESISWLDPIDESGGSSASSVHSRSSSKIRRRHIRSASGDTEAEFDAALDDAIEAAYDDGYEPEDPTQRPVNLDHLVDEDDVIAQALRKVQLARDRVRQSELEMQRLANDRGQRMKALQEEEEDTLPGGFYDGDDSEEEERILEELTTGYAMDDFSLGGQPRTSAVSKPPTTSNTVLSPVTEVTTLPSFSMAQGPIAPPPSQSLPKLPPGRRRSSSGRDSVRDRRLSGTNAKQLKIETQTLGPKTQEPATAGPMMQNPELPMSQQVKPAAGFIAQQRQTLGAAPSRTASLRRGASPKPPGIAVDGAPPTPPLPAEGHPDNRAGSPSMPRPPTLHRNFSSNSLRSIKNRNLSISNVDEHPEVSPGTPMSNPFANSSSTRLPTLPSLPTPVAAAFRDRITSGSATGGFRLFDNDIHTPASPSEPNINSDEAPFPLEPCPTEVLLRPFWLMRALYQTLAHPKGGYISTKLFVPRDAWRVKGVKIKNMEEKIGQCDLLTAALQKLARVNSEDADAVLEEMQGLETVLEQAQAFLTRRLGNEVGVQTAGAMFRDADGVVESGQEKPVPRNNSVSSKGAFSWRRLRSKTSSTNLGVAHERGGGRKESTAGLGAAGGLGPDAVSLPTLPMTNYPTSKPSRRDVMGVQFSGPNAHYMAALARLFDAAQTVDQIARQVEDPGLRHADKTQVGLELCTRHAAEFFAFYICRFVLQDLTLLMDKFIKRGREQVQLQLVTAMVDMMMSLVDYMMHRPFSRT